ncbi:MAG TPA: hypothetical protein VMW34_12945 [Anaerolineales bacterium]|jgi:hypothetical protein|nr:hypothetical protein [Anaerolineales bacterium]
MSPEIENHQDLSQKAGADSFYEPRTIPKKWDVSAFVSRGTPAVQGNTGQPTEPVDQSESKGLEDDTANWNPDPFPQPRTIPGKWDVSDLK